MRSAQFAGEGSRPVGSLRCLTVSMLLSGASHRDSPVFRLYLHHTLTLTSVIQTVLVSSGQRNLLRQYLVTVANSQLLVRPNDDISVSMLLSGASHRDSPVLRLYMRRVCVYLCVCARECVCVRRVCACVRVCCERVSLAPATAISQSCGCTCAVLSYQPLTRRNK